MNSTSVYTQALQLASVMSSESISAEDRRVKIASWIVVLILVAVIITICVYTKRSEIRFRNILLAFAANADRSTETIATIDNRGRFPQSVWCRTCNAYVDNIDDMCPHVGRKYFLSAMRRRFSEYWRHQLHQRYLSADQSINNRAATTNRTIDLEELIGGNRLQQHGIDRVPSALSISSEPAQTSTPNGANRILQRSQSEQEAETGPGRMGRIWREWSGRSVSSATSSGIGDSIRSRESNEMLMLHNPSSIRQFFRGRGRRQPLHRRPAPRILLHRSSTRQQRPRIDVDSLSNNLLRPDGNWNRQPDAQATIPVGTNATPRLQRWISEPSYDSRYRNRIRQPMFNIVEPASASLRNIQDHNPRFSMINASNTSITDNQNFSDENRITLITAL